MAGEAFVLRAEYRDRRLGRRFCGTDSPGALVAAATASFLVDSSQISVSSDWSFSTANSAACSEILSVRIKPAFERGPRVAELTGERTCRIHRAALWRLGGRDRPPDPDGERSAPGQARARELFSATLPMATWARPVRPCVPMTIRSMSCCLSIAADFAVGRAGNDGSLDAELRPRHAAGAAGPVARGRDAGDRLPAPRGPGTAAQRQRAASAGRRQTPWPDRTPGLIAASLNRLKSHGTRMRLTRSTRALPSALLGGFSAVEDTIVKADCVHGENGAN